LPSGIPMSDSRFSPLDQSRARPGKRGRRRSLSADRSPDGSRRQTGHLSIVFCWVLQRHKPVDMCGNMIYQPYHRYHVAQRKSSQLFDSSRHLAVSPSRSSVGYRLAIRADAGAGNAIIVGIRSPKAQSMTFSLLPMRHDSGGVFSVVCLATAYGPNYCRLLKAARSENGTWLAY
jgi:hypothetical protein